MPAKAFLKSVRDCSPEVAAGNERERRAESPARRATARRKKMEIKKYKHYVQYYETDKMGITHHSNYVRWMEEARVDFLKQIGWDYARLESEGIISPVVGVSCKYKHSTTFADTVTIEVAVAEYSGIKLRLKYTMTNEKGEVCCKGESEHCFVNEAGRIIMIKKDYPAFHELLTSLIEKSN